MARLTLPVLYNQMDTRWGGILLGFNTQAVFNFYNYACLICCLAMTAQYYGKDYNPVKINDSFKSMGEGKAFPKGSGDYIPGGFNLLFGDITETRTLTPTKMTDSQIGEIKSAIDNGWPVMIGIDYSPKTVEYNSHFVLVIDYNPADENDFTIADPIEGKIHSLKDYLGWYKPNARNTIESYVILRGTKPKVTSSMVTVGKDQWETMRANHDKWHQIVHYLAEGQDPNATPFESIQSTIAGYKSRSTDMENKANDANAKLAVSEQEIKNNYEQISRLKQQLLDLDKKHADDSKALIATQPNVEKMRGEYEARILELQGKIDAAMREKGAALLDLAACKAQGKDMVAGKNAIQTLIDLFFKTFKINLPK